MIKFPTATVQLTGEDGNAFAIIARTRRAMLDDGVAPEDVGMFMADAYRCESYGALLALVRRTVTVS